ncbi:AMP-binding protein [Algicola sagamiensis]|uniref:AMP-binding protein n=1 Tax=Algicola sagamiensis TaxID=163869 RepID=UPI000379D885|nr:AMP-binding protein [Algicola sagamiensis]
MSHTADIRFYTPGVSMKQLDQDTLILHSKMPLQPYAQNVSYWLKHWANTTPEQVFLAEKKKSTRDWHTVTYAMMWEKVQHVASAILSRGIQMDDKVILLSGNSIHHAMIQLACTLVGITYVPLSPSYSLIPQARQKLEHIFSTLSPSMVFAESGTQFSDALALLPQEKVCIVTACDPIPGSVGFDTFIEHPIHSQLNAFEKQVTPDTVVKILMTSGSTGFPKGVPNTHKMICANQQSLAQVWPFLTQTPPILLDWLPWHHTFGGNHNFYMVLRHGGSLYIDEGKPAPDAFQTSLDNLKTVSPTLYLNVPYGHGHLVPILEQDDGFAAHFFKHLQGIFTAASALPEETWLRWQALSEKHQSRAFLSSAWGCTETAPLVTNVHFPALHSNNIGLPLPGCDIKLERHDHLYELCVRGPNIFTGYLGEQSQKHVDEEGYFHTGDLATLVDSNDIQKGLRFEGRLTENFKLSNGNWVQVNTLRVKIIGLSEGLLQDVVVTGEHQVDIGLLLILSQTHCQKMLGDPTANMQEIIASARIRDQLEQVIEKHNQQHTAQTQQIRRVAYLTKPLDMAKNEITDKGYINQRAVLKNHQALVSQLHMHSMHSMHSSIIWLK